MVIAFIERVDLSVALSSAEFLKHFSLGDEDRGLASAAFFLTYSLLQAPAGFLADRVVHPKRFYALAFLSWGILTAGAGLAGSFVQLLIGRLLLGCAQSVLTPVGMLWIRSVCPEERRGAGIGLWQAGAKIGPAVGLPLSAWLLAKVGWQFLFVAVGLGSLLWLVPWWSIVPDEAPQQAAARAHDLPPGKRSEPSIFYTPLLYGVMIGTFCYQFFFYFCITWMPAYLTEQRHIALSSMGWYSAFSFGGMAILAVAAGSCADRLIRAGWGAFAVRKWFAVAGLLLGSTEVIGVWSPSRDVALAFAIISIGGLGLATANHWALTQTAFPRRLLGRAASMQALAASAPGFLAPLTVGWIKARTGGYTGPAELILLILLVGLAAYLIAVREKFAARD